MNRLLQWLQHGLFQCAGLLLVAGIVLLGGLDATGFWEPQELSAADRAIARARPAPPPPSAVDGAKSPGADPNGLDADPTPAPAATCHKVAPNNDGARSATERLTSFATSERGMRLPLALCGLLLIAGCVGIGARLVSLRAGVLTGLICLSFPLLSLQARQLTSELPAAAGTTLLLYALCTGLRPSRSWWRALDVTTALPAGALGAWLAFFGGGALHGLLVPLAAFVVVAAGDIPRSAYRWSNPKIWFVVVVAIAAVATTAILAMQLYDLRDPIPGTRQILGKSVVPSECYSTALGALWRLDDDVRMTFDGMFEQIAFGTFPWGIAAPIAIGLLLTSPRHADHTTALLALAWAGGAWLAATVFQRRVGFTVYAGFPAMALAIGVWLDTLVSSRSERNADPGDASPRVFAPGPLVGLFVLLGVLTLGKDLQAFPEKLTSLLVGSDAIKYPKQASLLGLPLRVWLLGLGMAIASCLAAALWTWPSTSPRRRQLSKALLAASIALTAAVSVFWVYGWHRALSRNLSTKGIFNTYQAEAGPSDALGIMGDLGNAPVYYGRGHGTHEKLAGNDALRTFLARPDRVFAMVPAAELCGIHRSAHGSFFVLDNSNTRTLLLSNRIANPRLDKNPLTSKLLRAEPTGIPNRPSGRVVYDDRIELIGWHLPPKVKRGEDLTVTLYFKVLRPVGGSWKVFAHFDGPSAVRFQGDHTPIEDRCPTHYWQEGDYIVDQFTVAAGDATHAMGTYELRVGFFTGSNPNWKNMKVSMAPEGIADNADRVRLAGVIVY